MSLYELMICDKTQGGCGHARHRHTKASGSPIQNARRGVGACRAVGSDGPCPCPRFKESEVTSGNRSA